MPLLTGQESQVFRGAALGSLWHGQQGPLAHGSLNTGTLKFIIGRVGVPAAGNKPTKFYQVSYLQWTQIVFWLSQLTCEVQK